ncbi:hypothetical protein [Desulfotomaculum sp. 1211_IL3151]|uniref:hypothetical protein n=1 Tax=Desulfotomaculum sp. 1211_IL3151 TaxID=3084055 RepID=UPI002FD9A9D9
MVQREKAKGKVIPFTPRTKPKLKKLNYVDPALKQLKKERGKRKRDNDNRSKVIQYLSIFIVICFIVYSIKFLM